jgi:hypothetical protein
LRKTLQSRNDTRYGHSNMIIDIEKVKRLNRAMQAGIIKQWPEMTEHIKQSKFPQIENICQEELKEIS